MEEGCFRGVGDGVLGVWGRGVLGVWGRGGLGVWGRGVARWNSPPNRAEGARARLASADV